MLSHHKAILHRTLFCADPGEGGLSLWEGKPRVEGDERQALLDATRLLPGVTCRRSTNQSVSVSSRSCPWTTFARCSTVSAPACALETRTRQLTGQCTLRRELRRRFPTAMCIQWRIKGEPLEHISPTRKYLANILQRHPLNVSRIPMYFQRSYSSSLPNRFTESDSERLLLPFVAFCPFAY